MQWNDLIVQLDFLRSEIRAERNLKTHISADDTILLHLAGLLEKAKSGKPTRKTIEVDVDEEGNPIFPYSGSLQEQAQHGHTEGVRGLEVGDVKGVVLPRTTPRIARKPQLEEVFDEAETPETDDSWKGAEG